MASKKKMIFIFSSLKQVGQYKDQIFFFLMWFDIHLGTFITLQKRDDSFTMFIITSISSAVENH